MEAVGSYIETLREVRGLQSQTVVALAGLENSTYLWRIEQGKLKNPGASQILAIIEAVGGSFEHVARLMKSDKATRADGKRLAIQWLNESQQQSLTDRIEQAIEQIREENPSYTIDDALEVLRQLQAHQDELLKEIQRRVTKR